MAKNKKKKQQAIPQTTANGGTQPATGANTQTKVHMLDAAFQEVEDKRNKAYVDLAASGGDFSAGAEAIEIQSMNGRSVRTSAFLNSSFKKDYNEHLAGLIKQGNAEDAKKLTFLDYVKQNTSGHKAWEGLTPESKTEVDNFLASASDTVDKLNEKKKKWEERKKYFENVDLNNAHRIHADSISRKLNVDTIGFTKDDMDKIWELQKNAESIEKGGIVGKYTKWRYGDPQKEFEKIKEKYVGKYDIKINAANKRVEDITRSLDPQAVYHPRANPGGRTAEKSGAKSLLKGAGGKAAAVVGLLGLGGVIGNMFSGGHRSNAELYNPNGYSQYYS